MDSGNCGNRSQRGTPMRDNDCSRGLLTMKQVFAGLIMLVCFGLNVAAQDWYHEREERFRGEEWRGHIFEHVRTDLDHIWSAGQAAPRERRRLDTTKRELADMQVQLREGGHYNEHELNDVIDSL